MDQLPSFQQAPLMYGILAASLIVVAVVLYVWLRKKPEPAQPAAAAAASAAPRDATVVFNVKRDASTRPAGGYTVSLPSDSGAYLIPLFGEEGTPGTPIPIREPSLYIGRDQQRAQIVFDDPSVSRLHARLIEESDGVFMLHDEGSASGTFVNDERVDLTPRQLKPGDFIEFGRQRVIFQSSDARLEL